MEALKRAGVAWSYKSILHFEKIGLIDKPENPTGNRLYTQKEIDNIVAKVVAYKRK